MAWSRSAFSAGTSAALHVADNSRSHATARSGEIPSALVRSRFSLASPELVQPLEVDRVLEAAGGMLQREVADLAIDASSINRDRTRPRAESMGVLERISLTTCGCQVDRAVP